MLLKLFRHTPTLFYIFSISICIQAHMHCNLISLQTTLKCCNQHFKFDNRYQIFSFFLNLIYMQICIIKSDTGWALQDWTQGKRADLLEKFPQHGELIKRLCKEWGSLMYKLQRGANKDLFLYSYKKVQLKTCPDILFCLKHSTNNEKS